MIEGKNRLILIIEDEEDILELLEYTLQKEGYETIGFLNANENVKKVLDEEKIDLILMDRNLPNIEGTSFIKDLRSNGYQNPVIYVTAKDKLTTPGTSLSGGQQQRLCIARTIAIKPEVILMDEPTSALDPISTEKIEALMLELKQDYTIITVTHNMQQAARVADYTAFFHLGKLIEYDVTETIFVNPTNKKTEDYITGRFG